MRKAGAVGVLLFLLVGLFAVPAVAAKAKEEVAVGPTGIQALLAPVEASLIKLGDYLPKLGGLLVILVVGCLVAIGVVALLEKLFKVIKLEKGIKKTRISDILAKGGIGLSLSELISEVVFFLIIIGTLITALEYYGLGTSVFMSQLLSYVPVVVAAVFILILGPLLAILISGIIRLVGGNLRIAHTDILSNVAQYAIIIVAALLALKTLGLGVLLTEKSKDIILGGLVLGLAISFGLGAKEKAGKFLDNIL